MKKPGDVFELKVSRQEAWVVLRALARYGESLPGAVRDEKGRRTREADPDKAPVTWVADRLLRLVDANEAVCVGCGTAVGGYHGRNRVYCGTIGPFCAMSCRESWILRTEEAHDRVRTDR